MTKRFFGRLPLFLALFLVSLSPLTLPAGEATLTQATKDEVKSFYKAGEISADAFAEVRINSFKDFKDLSRLDYGGGVGVNWFPFRTAGLGIETRADDTKDLFVDHLGGKLLGRLPFNRFALNYGLGAQFNLGPDNWDIFAEAGPEFRFTEHIGVFATVRGVRPVSSGTGEHILGLLGVRYAF